MLFSRIYGGRPLTRLETGLYAGIVAIVLAVFVQQGLDYMELAERAAVDATINNLVAAVNTRLAYAVMRGEAINPSTWAKRNPFELARMSPRNFRGQVESSKPGSLQAGSWAFDPSRAELVYLPRLRIGLETSDPEGALRFRPTLGRNGMSYTLPPTSPYRWE